MPPPAQFFHLFPGPHQKKLGGALVERLLEHAHAIKMVRSPTVGRNALDFMLAYHLGQAVWADPTAHFHLMTKDGGFDSLVELLRSRRVKICRHADWSSLPLSQA